jgi:hypothetical protein
VIAVTDHQAATPLIALVGQLGYISVDLGLERDSEHPPGALPDDLIDQRRPAAGGATGVDYGEHGLAFPTDAATPVLLGDLSINTPEGRPSRA